MEERIYSVTALTRYIKNILENNSALSGIWIRGEIYNLTYHSSGHIYFTLKDENALVAATFFKNANKNLTFKLEEGMTIIAFGSITLYEKRGSYQLNVLQARPEGIGDLQKKIEELKKKLLAEGIFDPERKRALPFLPRRLGIVTSPTGAAVRDIVKVALRRYPNIEIVLAPAKVQGEDAAATIARGINELNRPEYGIDVIIAGRGGGSFEDLMPFNEEVAVRAFAESRVPIISAVGHQIDHPLSDDAADYYAPTPSAAAEIAVPLKKELNEEIQYLLLRTHTALQALMRQKTLRLKNIRELRIFREPMELINRFAQQLTDTEQLATISMKETVRMNREKFLSLPDIHTHILHIIEQKTHRHNMAIQAIDQLSPLSSLRRGYSIALNKNRSIIKNIDAVSEGDMVSLLLYDGVLSCQVQTKKRGAPFGKEKAVSH